MPTALSTQTLAYEWHLLRQDAEGNPNQGSDGALWLPSRGRQILTNNGPIAIVADGVGDEDGKGVLAINAFLHLLKITRDFHEAYFELFGKTIRKTEVDPESTMLMSTFLAAMFPGSTSEPLHFLHAGDSLMVRLRNGMASMMTPEHSYWAETGKLLTPEELHEARTESVIKTLKTPKELQEILDGLLKGIEPRIKRDFEKKIEGDVRKVMKKTGMEREKLAMLRPAQLLCRLLWFFRGMITHDLSDSRNRAERIMSQEVTEATVEPGDRYALFTDGIFPDVLPLQTVKEVLETSASPAEAVRDLMHLATTSGLKYDDRTALVTFVKTEEESEVPYDSRPAKRINLVSQRS